MIIFTIGTSEPFDRLVSVADAVAEACQDRVLVQGGRSHCRLTRAEIVPFLPYDELVKLVAHARIVVTHAGAGSALLALSQGKRPILVPRLRRHGEAIDDHQVVFAQRMTALGLAHVVEDPARLPQMLRSLPGEEAQPSPRTASLGSILRDHLVQRLGRPSEERAAGDAKTRQSGAS
jgi:UDP-N-acetylglucosamine transferase subunit ALG13